MYEHNEIGKSTKYHISFESRLYRLSGESNFLEIYTEVSIYRSNYIALKYLQLASNLLYEISIDIAK